MSRMETRLDVSRYERVSEIRYRRIFESTPHGILILDFNSQKIVDANPFITDLLGYEQEGVLGKEFLAPVGGCSRQFGTVQVFHPWLFHRKDSCAALGRHQHQVLHAATDTLSVVYRRKDGHYGLIEPETA